MKPVLLCVGTVLLLQPALSLGFSNADDTDDVGYDRTRRGWSMMRLGRGLQMLRLGKRTAPSRPADSAPSTPEQMRALLSALIEESREEFRRQPPLPRYGRELDLAQENPDDVLPLLGDAYVPRVLPLHYNHYIHASRFKRSAGQGRRFQSPSSYLGQQRDGARPRALPLPRIGRYLNLYKLRPAKAVPVPRIGREEMDVVTNNKQMASKDVTGRGHYLTQQDTPYGDQKLVEGAASRLAV